jgi:chemotaxis signal transduction protein
VTREILEERARALAQPLADEPPDPDARDLVFFTLAGERFAAAAEHIDEAFAPAALTPIPGDRPWLLGIVAHRGGVLPVLDLRTLLAPGADHGAPLTHVVAVAAAGQAFGIAAEAVEETARAVPAELDAARVTVIDLAALASDRRLRIDDSG